MKVLVLDKKLDSGVKINTNVDSIIGIITLDSDQSDIRKFANRYFIYFFKMLKSEYKLVSEYKVK